MKIGLDVMGGDFAPKATLSGAILARQTLSETDDIVLIGKQELIRDELIAMNANPEDFIIIGCHRGNRNGRFANKGALTETQLKYCGRF
jgi:fatty acid/phospholipid biosynthesis enzyme